MLDVFLESLWLLRVMYFGIVHYRICMCWSILYKQKLWNVWRSPRCSLAQGAHLAYEEVKANDFWHQFSWFPWVLESNSIREMCPVLNFAPLVWYWDCHRTFLRKQTLGKVREHIVAAMPCAECHIHYYICPSQPFMR